MLFKIAALDCDQLDILNDRAALGSPTAIKRTAIDGCDR